MRNRIGKCERRHRICEIELGKAKGGIAYAKSDWEKRRVASHMRNRIGKCERWHRICETGLGNPKGAIAFSKSNWESSWPLSLFLIGLKAAMCYQRKHSSSQKVTCPPFLENILPSLTRSFPVSRGDSALEDCILGLPVLIFELVNKYGYSRDVPGRTVAVRPSDRTVTQRLPYWWIPLTSTFSNPSHVSKAVIFVSSGTVFKADADPRPVTVPRDRPPFTDRV